MNEWREMRKYEMHLNNLEWLRIEAGYMWNFLRNTHVYLRILLPVHHVSCGLLKAMHARVLGLSETHRFIISAPHSNIALLRFPVVEIISNAMPYFPFPSMPWTMLLISFFFIFSSLPKFISNWIMLQKIWGFLHCLPYCF